MPDHWPRLSETLPHREPGRCNACGEPEPPSDQPAFRAHDVWQEHNQFDRPEPRFVQLCRACSAKIIDPHPRLYARLNPHTPAPGAMPLCLGCDHRDAMRCACPAAKANGGEGIAITGPKPSRVHFYRRGKGARSGWEEIYPGPSTGCTGRAEAGAPTPAGEGAG